MPNSYYFDTSLNQATAIHVSDPNADESLLVAEGVTLRVSGGTFDYVFDHSTAGTGDVDLTNLGTVINTGAQTTYLNAPTVRVTNMAPGTFLNTLTSTSGLYGALTVQGSDFASVVNHGSLTGPVGAYFYRSNDASLVNTGTITGTGTNSFATAVISRSVLGAGMLDIANSGEIIGAVKSPANGGGRWAIVLENTSGTSVQTLNLSNSGLIQGIVVAGTTGDVVVNSGTIDGEIRLSYGGDLYRGTGSGIVTGEVLGGADDDTLIGGALDDRLDGGTENDLLAGHGGDDNLNGDAGTDYLLGGAGNDSLDGGSENDTLAGNAGDDTLAGGSGADLLVGQDGSDALDGGENDDTMDGGAGDDILEGGDGNDILRGRSGEDDLAGGLGMDLLTGGQGADSFVFRSIAETVAGANRDQILDFEQGVDLIVVAGLSPGVFEFRGTAAFAPSGNPELRLFETASGSTIVQIDADGNGIAEAEIRVANVTGLTAEDFVL